MTWAQITNLKGDPGDAGPDPQLRVDSGNIQWRAGDDGTWTTLVPLSDLTGADGADGTGVTILGSYDTVGDLETAHPTGSPGDAYLVAGDLYVWSDSESEWVSVGNIQGPAGENIELRVAEGHIQWRLEGAGSWTNLIDVDELEGPAGPRGATWFTGAGSPGAITGQQPGDLYLDTLTGVVYHLGD